MPRYAGETVLVTQTATLDDAPLTDADVAAVRLTIYDAAYSTVVLAETPMTWDAAANRWEHPWDTTAVDAGTYHAKVEIEDPTGALNWEYKRIRLEPDPLPG